MKEIINRIKANSFKVWTDHLPGRVGTAFAISDSTFLTANHVVNPEGGKKPKHTVKLSKPNSGIVPYEGTIESIDIQSDLARIVTTSSIQAKAPFDVVEPAPEIAQMCIWGGFPKLVGEPSPRLRFAQGMVSSEVYDSQGREFFELDGMFNSGHSGSAVINSETGNLIGVVIKSAGSLDKEFDKAISIFKVIEAIQSEWQIFEQTRKEMEDMWNSLNKYIKTINSQLEKISMSFGPLGMPLMPSTIPSISVSPFPWYHSEIVAEVKGKLPDNTVKILKEMNIDVHVSESDTVIYASTDDAFTALFQLVLQWTKLMKGAIEESYQMGIGIAVCQDSVERLL